MGRRTGRLFVVIVNQIQNGNYWSLCIFWFFVFLLITPFIREKIKLKKEDKEGALSLWFLFQHEATILIAALVLTLTIISYANYHNQ